MHLISFRKEPSNPDSINVLKNVAQLDFDKHRDQGIDPLEFGEALISSGLVLEDEVSWITFHGNSDFAYLLKVLTCKPMPNTQEEFCDLLDLYFPNCYDVKMISSYTKRFNGGLQDLSSKLGV